jgi:hypothetical protein
MEVSEVVLKFGGKLGAYFGKHPIQLLLMGMCIPLAGFFIEVLDCFICVDALGKSGSVLVAFTIFVVFINHSIKEYEARQKELLNVWGGSPDKTKDHIVNQLITENHGVLDPEERAKQEAIAGYVVDELMSDTIPKIQGVLRDNLEPNIRNYRAAAVKLSLVEATLGIVGTLVWGFG